MPYDGYSTELDELEKIARPEGALYETIESVEIAIDKFYSAVDLMGRADQSMLSRPHTEWNEIQQLVLRIMQDNHNNLALSQQALLEIVKRYRILEGE